MSERKGWIHSAGDWIRGLSPYQSLALLVVPLAVVEPLKLIAVFIAGKGHWFTGVAVEVIAYSFSLFVTHRLFKMVKPKLLQIRWFNRFWTWLSNVLLRIKMWFQTGLSGRG